MAWWLRGFGLWDRNELGPELQAIGPGTEDGYDQTAVVVERHPYTSSSADHFSSSATPAVDRDVGESSTVLVDSVQGDAGPHTAVADDAGTRPERPANTEEPTEPESLKTTRSWTRRRETRRSCRDTDTTVADDAEKRTDASEPDTAVRMVPGASAT